jgi:protein tyrosine phosphatase (PTP) superfamily phosphohydrolase (DUF442 family)
MRLRSLWILPLAAAALLPGACRSQLRGGLEKHCTDAGCGAPSAEAISGLPNFGVVDDGLYRCGQPSGAGCTECVRQKVKTIVSVRSAHDDAGLIRGTGLRYARIPMHAWKVNDRDVAQFLKIATDPECRPVMLHCAQGQDRTGVLVAAYRRVVQGWSAEQAIAEMETYGTSPLWGNLRTYVRRLDVEKMKALVASLPSPECPVY